MTRLVLWRHGQTAWNFERRWQGQINIELDETGIAQAAEAAPRVAAYRPDLIVSSDLLRATQTAGALAKLLDHPVELDARLRERDFGPWQGLTTEEVQERFPEEYRSWDDTTFAYPGIETQAELAKRVGEAVREVADRLGGNGTAVLTLHGGSARAACGTLLGWPQELWHTLSGLRNCGTCELRYTPRWGWQLHSHNL